MSIRRLGTGLGKIITGLASLVEPTPPKLEQLANDLRSIRLDAIQFGYDDVVKATGDAEAATQGLLTSRSNAQHALEAIHSLGQVILTRLTSAADKAEIESISREGASPKLLVVDDSRVAAAALANAFLQHGFSVRSVSNMDDALAELRDFRPCILVSDVFMPNLDLTRICRSFRDTSEDRCGLIVLVSGSSGETVDVLLDSVKPDAFVPKMAGTNQVVDRVLEIWQKRQLHKSCSVRRVKGSNGDSAPSCDSHPKGAR